MGLPPAAPASVCRQYSPTRLMSTQFLCANSFVHMFAGAVAFGGACPGPVGEAAGFDFSLAISPPRARQKQERTCPHNFRRPVEVNERCRRFSGRTFHPLSASTFLSPFRAREQTPFLRLRSRVRDFSSIRAFLRGISHLGDGASSLLAERPRARILDWAA